MTIKIDNADLKILNEIQHDCSQGYDSISKKVNLSPTSCLRRLRKLEKAGFVDGKHAVLDHEKLGFTVKAIVSVELSQDVLDLGDRLEKICKNNPEIQQCYITSSNVDFLLFLIFRDVAEFTGFLDNLISIFHNLSVREYESSVVVRTVKNDLAIPLLQV